MNLKDYISIARPTHWFKNIFIIPGVIFAAILTKNNFDAFYLNFLYCIVSSCLAASANYVINEWLDAKYDKFHPTKKERPAVLGKLRFRYVFIEYLFLISISIFIATKISIYFFCTTILFLIMGVLYNLKQFRTKDKMYLDVISESLNNPIRLMLGWFTVTTYPLPPSSLVIGYWMGGAFLMAIKRYAEYKAIGDPLIASSYRNSFKYYNEENLLVSSFFYASCSSFFLGIFLIKYKLELLFSLPLLAGLFAWYLKIGMQKDSPAQNPEKLFMQKHFIIYLLLLSTIICILLIIDQPSLKWFLNNAFLEAQQFKQY